MINNENTCNCIQRLGFIFSLLALAGILTDFLIGSVVTGGNLTNIPQDAAGMFDLFRKNWLLGLYNLDLLTSINQLLLIPAYIALYAVLRKVRGEIALLALVIFIMGTTMMAINNSALSVFELSQKYSAAGEAQKLQFLAAGDAMLSRGTHGSLNVFMGFFLPNLAGFIMSFLMINGRIFSRTASYFGMIGSVLMMLYLILVTFFPTAKSMATAIAAPGGILLIAWIIIFSVKLYKIGFKEKC